MGYQVSKSGKTWRLIFETKGMPRRNVAKDSSEATAAGFYSYMTFEEAKTRQLQLKAEGILARETAARERARQNKLKADAFLSKFDAEGFEAIRKRKKINDSHWNTMQKIIVQLPDPSEWTTEAAYAIFKKMRISPAYAKKLRHYLNHWAKFIGQKHKTYYNLLEQPTVTETRNLRLNVSRSGGKSIPLTSELLAQIRNKLTVENYNWLYLSIWFGLRPREVDRLTNRNPELWYLENDTLAVFQEKLLERGVPEDKCWKFIQVLFPEQRLAIALLDKPFTRPDNKILAALAPGLTCYGGRVGFVQLLKSKGLDLFQCRDFMGHQSVTTTEKYYERRSANHTARKVR